MEEQEAPPPARKTFLQSFLMGRNPLWTVMRVLIWIGLTVVLFKFVFVPIRVTGSSMTPTYRDGQITLVNRLAYRTQEPQRKDIVALQFAGREILLLKRILGLPGETVQIVNGHVHVNGERVEEPYAYGIVSHRDDGPRGSGQILRTSKAITLGPEEYFLVGDNRVVSELHIEPRRKILGKVVF
jgi:signal peptidase I